MQIKNIWNHYLLLNFGSCGLKSWSLWEFSNAKMHAFWDPQTRLFILQTKKFTSVCFVFFDLHGHFLGFRHQPHQTKSWKLYHREDFDAFGRVLNLRIRRQKTDPLGKKTFDLIWGDFNFPISPSMIWVVWVVYLGNLFPISPEKLPI